MKRRIISVILVFVLNVGLSITALASGTTANPTASTVYINGETKDFEAYTIAGNNYFKLRDLAYVLSGTDKQFEVAYDVDTKAIALTSGEEYTAVGGELAQSNSGQKAASPTSSEIYLDGKELNLTVYTIGSNNFVKLRDLMEALDVYVGYNVLTKAITLDTSKGYTPEPPPLPSAVGQFLVGAVYDQDTGIGIGGATVELEYTYSYGRTTTRATTDSYGYYTFANLPDGTYIISVIADGYEKKDHFKQLLLPSTEPFSIFMNPDVEPDDPADAPLCMVTVSIKNSFGYSNFVLSVSITHTSMKDTSFALHYNYTDDAYICVAPAGRYKIEISSLPAEVVRYNYSGFITVTKNGSNRFNFILN